MVAPWVLFFLEDVLSQLSDYQNFIHLSRYARWREELGRRETWDETVDRYIAYFTKRTPQIPQETFQELKTAILNLEVLPSMRALMTAGKALEVDELGAYNCAFAALSDPRVFSEILYILMNGTGCGFSVERQYVNQLPTVAESFHDSETVLRVSDSKIGWAVALRELISLLYAGQIPKWDLSKVRPAGARLKTFGGRASGPEPLNDLMHQFIRIFRGAAGRKLTSLECHDLVCFIANAVIVGGVRRSALLSLSNLSDDRMRNAKSGQWWESNPQRALANNTAVYADMPDSGVFMREWLSLYESKSGERGIFNHRAAEVQVRRTGRRKTDGIHFGANPCGEVILRAEGGLCNLTEVVIRESDTIETLKRKVRLASILGTMQSTLTNFRYLRATWRKNAEEERLLGVSLTGIAGNTLMNGMQGVDTLKGTLQQLKQEVIDTNVRYAELLDIAPSVACTTVKPSGTASALADCSSGIHAWYSDYFIRRVRGDKKDPLSQLMYYSGVPAEDDYLHPEAMWVFSFPMKAPEGAVHQDARSAIEQLELYRIYKNNWCEHNVSITVTVKESEWMEVGAYVYKNFDDILGVSFLPESNHVYKQAPYTKCSKEDYEKAVSEMPTVNWNMLPEYETYDQTTGTQELACVAGGCEIR